MLEQMLKFLPIEQLFGIAASLLVIVGNWLKDKDPGLDGADDALGNVFVAMAPAIAAVQHDNQNALHKALRVVQITIKGYLDGPGSSPASKH